MSGARRRGIGAAASAVIATGVSVWVVLATSSPGWATVGGLVSLVVLLAALEWWRASSENAAGVEEKRQRVSVKIKTRNVRGSTVMGVHKAPSDADAKIRMRTGDVSDDSKITGYDAD